jgi:hypothetical protein
MSQTLLSLAGFQVILSGRFWVIAEEWEPGGSPIYVSIAGIRPMTRRINFVSALSQDLGGFAAPIDSGVNRMLTDFTL